MTAPEPGRDWTGTVRYSKATAEATPARRTTGVLCRGPGGRYLFRIYEPGGSFTDDDLEHDDLTVTTPPGEFAAFYRIGHDHALDHSPEVLGLRPAGEETGH